MGLNRAGTFASIRVNPLFSSQKVEILATGATGPCTEA
jgi:hypothetical protein